MPSDAFRNTLLAVLGLDIGKTRLTSLVIVTADHLSQKLVITVMAVMEETPSSFQLDLGARFESRSGSVTSACHVRAS